MSRIALSKASGNAKYEMYKTWLLSVDASVECVDLWSFSEDYSMEKALEQMNDCDGFVLTGGSDVEPERYGRPEETPRCHVDPQRDALEFALLQRAKERRMPILGICRGAQLLNVAYGGTLIVDIPTDYSTEIIHLAVDQVDSRHSIELEGGSLLKKITRQAEGEVNSAHHQAVEHLAADFSVSARSADGIIEAFESTPTHGESHVMAVQWHPERLELENIFSHRIAEHFLFECLSYSSLVKKTL